MNAHRQQTDSDGPRHSWTNILQLIVRRPSEQS